MTQLPRNGSSRPQLLISSLLCLGLSLYCSSLALAEYIEPGSIAVDTAEYTPDKNQLKVGTYHYKIKWKGISVARGEVQVFPPEDGSGKRKVSAKTRTSGIVSAFYKMKHHSQSVFDEETFRPYSFSSDQKEQSKAKYREVDFKSDGSVSSTRWAKGKSKTKQEFKTSNSTFDPISAAFLAKSVPLEVGKKVEVDVYNGKHRYLISFNVKKKEKIKVNNKKVEAFKVVPTVKKLTDTKGETKLKSATLWVSADEDREILKLESKVWIGSVVAKFHKFSDGSAIAENQDSSEQKENTARAQMSESIEDLIGDPGSTN